MKYAGIGSRETPKEILSLMEVVAENLGSRGWTLRTGGAPGADTAFFDGANMESAHLIELYLPWDGFNDFRYAECWSRLYVNYTPSPEAFAMAEKYHSSYRYLKQGAKKLMARNSHQIFGPDMNDPVDCVICWTEGGKLKGGTAQALRIAIDHDIPIFNLGNELTFRLFSDIMVS